MATLTDAQVRSILKEEVCRLKEGSVRPQDLSDDMLLFDINEDDKDNLGLDSLDALEIGMAIEDQYEVTIPEDIDFSELATINRLVSYILRLQAEQEQPVE